MIVSTLPLPFTLIDSSNRPLPPHAHIARSGQAVGRAQQVMGVEFSYQPPPKSVVPFAAALKGNLPRLGREAEKTCLSCF